MKILDKHALKKCSGGDALTIASGQFVGGYIGLNLHAEIFNKPEVKDTAFEKALLAAVAVYYVDLASGGVLSSPDYFS